MSFLEGLLRHTRVYLKLCGGVSALMKDKQMCACVCHSILESNLESALLQCSNGMDTRVLHRMEKGLENGVIVIMGRWREL